MLKSIVALSKQLSIGPQPNEKLLERIADKGFKTVINLTNKGEYGQILSPEEEEKQVKELGMKYVHMPVSMARLKAADVEQVYETVMAQEGPVFLHCRVGQRSGPLGLICYGLKKKLTSKKVFERADKLGLEWNAPFLTSVIETHLKAEVA